MTKKIGAAKKPAQTRTQLMESKFKGMMAQLKLDPESSEYCFLLGGDGKSNVMNTAGKSDQISAGIINTLLNDKNGAVVLINISNHLQSDSVKTRLAELLLGLQKGDENGK